MLPLKQPCGASLGLLLGPKPALAIPGDAVKLSLASPPSPVLPLTGIVAGNDSSTGTVKLAKFKLTAPSFKPGDFAFTETGSTDPSDTLRVSLTRGPEGLLPSLNVDFVSDPEQPLGKVKNPLAMAAWSGDFRNLHDLTA